MIPDERVNAISEMMNLPAFLMKQKSETYDRKEPVSVYAFTGGAFAKIGIAKDVRARLAQVQTYCPIKIRLSYHYEFESRLYANVAEREAHDLLREFRVHGEWFRIDAQTAIYRTSIAVDGTRMLVEKHKTEECARNVQH